MQNTKIMGHGSFYQDFKGKPEAQAMYCRVKVSTQSLEYELNAFYVSCHEIDIAFGKAGVKCYNLDGKCPPRVHILVTCSPW
jgi:hypothetical protein